MSLQSEEIFAVSPSGQVVIWRKCEWEEPYWYCQEYISDSTFTTNKRFVPDSYAWGKTYQFISDDILLFWTKSINSRGYGIAADLYLLDINTNEKTLLIENKNEDRFVGDFFLSPSGKFLVHNYHVGYDLTSAPYIEFINLEENKFLDLKIRGWYRTWVSDDVLKFRDDLGYTLLINIRTGEIDEYFGYQDPLASPDGNWQAYSDRTNKGAQILIQGLSQETDFVIPDAGSIYATTLGWSPSGDRIIYSLFQSLTRRHIKIFDIKTREVTLLIEGEDDRNLGFKVDSWSPDQQWFVISLFKHPHYMSGGGDEHDYYVCNNNECKLLNPPNTEYCSRAIWINE